MHRTGSTVTDSTGAVVSGAKVTLTGAQGTNSMTTGDEGRFFFGTLSLGAYSVKVEKQGFRSAEFNAIQVLTGRTSTISAKLEPAAVTEVVEVSSTTVAVDTTSTVVQANLPDTFYQSVPVARNVASLFYVAPGAVDGGGTGRANPSVSGATGLENMYTADGVNITDSAFGGLGVFTRRQGSVGSGINLSFIKEVNVKTSAFEPQYGQADGGLVQLVTKSGSTRYHGEIGAYFAPQGAGVDFQQTDAYRTNKNGFNFNQAAYDLDGELGGYVPRLQNHLFFFGSFDPTWNQQFVGAATGSGLASMFPNGMTLFNRVFNYAGKLTWVINDKQKIEASVFGDPSWTNTGEQNFVLNTPNDTAMSHWNYGTMNFVTRYNGTLTPSWLVNASFTYATNNFTEIPKYNGLQVTDRTDPLNVHALQGFGSLEDHRGTNYGFNIDTQKIVNWKGQHTLSLGYSWTNPQYNDLSNASGGYFDVPSTNASGGAYLFCTPGDPACPLGGKQFLWSGSLTIPTTKQGPCPLCPLYPVNGVMKPVYVNFGRGRFDSGITPTFGKGMAAYANDTWRITPRITLNLGLRWEQWHMEGTGSAYTFTGNWAPRLGISVDPWGDGKTKIYFNYGLYNYWTPLDAAVRSLSGEKDILGVKLAPVSTNGIADISPNGSLTLAVDAAHILNQATGGIASSPSLSASTFGTGFAPGTAMMYQTEYVGGFERQVKGGVVISGRFVYRYMPRAVDDVAGVSPEGLVNNPNMSQFYYIANPGPGLDLFPNEHETSYTGAPPAPDCPTVARSGVGNACTVDQIQDANTGFVDPATHHLWNNGQGILWTKVNGYWGGEQGAQGQPIPDGVPDGFPKVYHYYKAVEIEANKSFSNNWALRANWRLAWLSGNYEGAFRNDNGQTDPNISSLFDFTNGIIGMLGDQYLPGPLNTDRLSIINIYTSYTPTKSFLKGFDLGVGLSILSGTPVSQLADHPAYGNSGEIPLGGRGLYGRTPISGGLNLHADRVVKLSERFNFHLTADLFNVTNAQPVRLYDQNSQINFSPDPNVDFTKVSSWVNTGAGFQRPFYARFAVRWVF